MLLYDYERRTQSQDNIRAGAGSKCDDDTKSLHSNMVISYQDDIIWFKYTNYIKIISQIHFLFV